MAKKTFGTLDGMRGVAALCIVLLHDHRYFFDPVPSAQMAVDLFFVLSGFVLAYNYAQRFRDGMTPRTFLLARFARLYPLYLLGILLGLAVAMLATHFKQGSVDWTWSQIATSLPFNLFMIPTPIGGSLFPLNGIMWTIFLELVVNLIWALTWRYLESTKVLLAVIAASGIAFAAFALVLDTTALGVGWNTFFGGVTRVLFSFMVGVLIQRYYTSIRVPKVPVLVLLLVLPVLVALPLNTVGQLGSALVVFPVLVLLGAHVEPGGFLRQVCMVLGVASYGIYVLHKRLYDLSYGFLLQVVGIKAEDFAPWVGLAYLVALVAVAYWLAQHFEPPARRWLTRKLAPESIAARRESHDLS